MIGWIAVSAHGSETGACRDMMHRSFKARGSSSLLGDFRGHEGVCLGELAPGGNFAI